jgi:hypothetical protein
MVLTIGAATERLDQIVLTLEGAGASTLTRRLNLTPVPADGRVLALVVAADEMLVASADERLVRKRGAETEAAPPSGAPATAPAAASPPAPAAERAPETASAPTKPESAPAVPEPLLAVATPVRAAAAPRHRTESAAAVTFAFDHFSGGKAPKGLTQLGFDLGWRRRVGSRAYGLLAAQARQGLSESDAFTGSTVEMRLLGVRLAVGMGLIDDGGRLALGVDLGARAGRLWLEGSAQPGSAVAIYRHVATFAYADAMVTLDIRLGQSSVALRLAVGGGLPLRTSVGEETTKNSSGQTMTTPITGMSGPAFESQGGIVLSF